MMGRRRAAGLPLAGRRSHLSLPGAVWRRRRVTRRAGVAEWAGLGGTGAAEHGDKKRNEEVQRHSFTGDSPALSERYISARDEIVIQTNSRAR
ncbi:hypothetical protein E2C01_041308 [Portunus trituberculatus]|uniref:Uncharacterized protein n=1 Tax=Portunus trituberculatus TaxID=210409 RepID=A0A5B7FRK1_PORTR|nr:hypothetical protein [Portunus trituberculatus]